METFSISVPKMMNFPDTERMRKLCGILQGFSVDCELDSTGMNIIYGPGVEDESLAEEEFVQTMIDIFDARTA